MVGAVLCVRDVNTLAVMMQFMLILLPRAGPPGPLDTFSVPVSANP